MKKILTAAVILSLLLLCFTPLVKAAERATLYINDAAWADDSILPFIESDGKKLVPAKAFASLNGISISTSEILGSLLVENGDKYLSYNLTFGSCLDESGNVTKCEIFRYGGEIYLEPYAICEKFGLSFETAFAPDGYLAARLADSARTKAFSELLTSYSEESEVKIPYLYNPAGKTVSGTFMHPVLLVPSSANVLGAIELLKGHCVTFAIAPSDIMQYSEALAAIYANKHVITYYMDESTNADEFKSQMDTANKYLFSVIGKTCRTYVSTLGHDKIPKINGYFAKSCRLHLVLDDLRNEVMVLAALYYSPNSGSYNFMLASDRASRNHYKYFFQRLESFNTLRSMPLSESSSDR